MIFFLRIAIFASILLVPNFPLRAAMGGMEEERDRPQVVRPCRSISALAQDILQNLNEKSRIMKEMLEFHIEDLPVDEREEVVRYTRIFLRRDTLSSHARYILKRIATTPKEKRRMLVRQVQSLIGRDMSGEDITHLLGDMAQLPCQNLDEFMECVRPFLRGESNAYSMLSIMQHIGNIPEAERGEVVRLTGALLTTPGVDSYTRKKILEEVQDLPHTQRQSIIEGARLLLQGESRSYTIRHLLRSVRNLPSDQRQDIVRHTASFLINRMDVYNKTFLLEVIAGVPSDQRASCVRATHILRRRGMTAHDFIQLIQALSRVEVDKEERARQVLQSLDRQLTHHRLTEAQILFRMTRLISNLPVAAVAVDIAGQEALSEERDIIYVGYREILETTPEGKRIQHFLRMNAFEAGLSDLQNRLRKALGFNFLSRKETFRLRTVLEGIPYVRSIRPEFRPPAPYELPRLTQLVGALYLLLKEKSANERDSLEFVRAYLSDHFDSLQSVFPDAMGTHSSAGFFLEDRASQRFIVALSEYLTGEREVFPFIFNQRNLRALKHLARDHMSDGYIFLNPMMEAILMSMRGHCPEGQLDNPKVGHAKACADGVYLNFMRAFSEVPGIMGDLSAAMQAVSIVSCATQVYPPA